MDLIWEFHKGVRGLPEVDRFETEKQKAAEEEKYLCCSCGQTIGIAPGYVFDHYGWHPPEIDCGAYLVRQLEFQDKHEILYLCKHCYETRDNEHQHEKHLKIEKRFGIPRP